MNKERELERLLEDIKCTLASYDKSFSEVNQEDYHIKSGIGTGAINMVKYFIKEAEKRLDDE